MWEKSYHRIVAIEKDSNARAGKATFLVVDDYLNDIRYGILERLKVEPEMRNQGLGKLLFSKAISQINSFELIFKD